MAFHLIFQNTPITPYELSFLLSPRKTSQPRLGRLIVGLVPSSPQDCLS